MDVSCLKFYNILSPERGCTAALRGFLRFLGAYPFRLLTAFAATFPRGTAFVLAGNFAVLPKAPSPRGLARRQPRLGEFSGAPLGELPPQAAEGANISAKRLPHSLCTAAFYSGYYW